MDSVPLFYCKYVCQLNLCRANLPMSIVFEWLPFPGVETLRQPNRDTFVASVCVAAIYLYSWLLLGPHSTLPMCVSRHPNLSPPIRVHEPHSDDHMSTNRPIKFRPTIIPDAGVLSAIQGRRN